MSTQSAWLKEAVPEYPSLSESISTDVVVVGGGITGITTAYYLAKAGKKVVLLEKNRLLNGDTGYTTAFFTHVLDASLVKLAKTFSKEEAKLAWESNQEIISEVERIIQTETIDCEFTRCSAKIFAHDQDGREFLQKECSLAQELGFSVAFKEDGLAFAPHGYMDAPNQARLHPVKYLRGLAAKAVEAGASIFEGVHVHDIKEQDDQVTVTTSKGTIHAKDVVIATHGPITDGLEFASRLRPMRTYLIELEIPTGKIANGLYWNTEDPYHYFRVDTVEGKDFLLYGGEDHETGRSDIPEDEHFSRLEMSFKQLFPDLKYTRLSEWSGQIFESVDGLPFIGLALGEKHMYIATGFGGNGMTFGSISAKLLSDLLLGRENTWKELYKTTRIHELLEIMKRGAISAAEMLHGRFTSEVDSVDEITPGTGKILMEHGSPVAVFKNKEGKITKLSGLCTHLKCTVKWNETETSWDCPCHGSRFDTAGKVLTGPATEPLEQK